MNNQMTLPVGGVAGAWRGESRDTSRFGQLIAALRRQLAVHRVYKQTYEELMTLTDRELDDIGIARCDIRTMARETAKEAVPA